jgi:hypothetical protein
LHLFLLEYKINNKVSGVVRGNLLLAAFLVTPSAGGTSCQVSYSLCVDLRGSIPAWIVARVASEQPLVLAGIRDAIVRNAEAGEAVHSDPLLQRFDRIKVTLGPPQTSAPIPLARDGDKSGDATAAASIAGINTATMVMTDGKSATNINDEFLSEGSSITLAGNANELSELGVSILPKPYSADRSLVVKTKKK